jgi:hypothetical protein
MVRVVRFHYDCRLMERARTFRSSVRVVRVVRSVRRFALGDIMRDFRGAAETLPVLGSNLAQVEWKEWEMEWKWGAAQWNGMESNLLPVCSARTSVKAMKGKRRKGMEWNRTGWN